MALFDENEGTTNPVTPSPEIPSKEEEKAAAIAQAEKEIAERKAKKEEEEAKKETKKEDEAKVEVDEMPEYKPGKKPDVSILSDQNKLRHYLMSYPKMAVFCPLAPGEKAGSTEVVIVQGIRLNIVKGNMVELPEPFAKVIMNHYNVGQIENFNPSVTKRIVDSRNQAFN